jgi:hypothetical protein
MYTGNQTAVLLATKKFDILTDTKYLSKPDNLIRGDILLGVGHTAIVVYDLGRPINAAKINAASSFSKALSGVYKVSAYRLNVRCGAGTSNDIITTIPKGTIVRCYGYYTEIGVDKWLFVQLNYKNATYTGFVSAKYLTVSRRI